MRRRATSGQPDGESRRSPGPSNIGSTGRSDRAPAPSAAPRPNRRAIGPHRAPVLSAAPPTPGTRRTLAADEPNPARDGRAGIFLQRVDFTCDASESETCRRARPPLNQGTHAEQERVRFVLAWLFTTAGRTPPRGSHTWAARPNRLHVRLRRLHDPTPAPVVGAGRGALPRVWSSCVLSIQ